MSDLTPKDTKISSRGAFIKAAAPTGDTSNPDVPVVPPEESKGARFGNITIFPDHPVPPAPDDDLGALPVSPPVPDVTDNDTAFDPSMTLTKPLRSRGKGGARTWRPNPSFPVNDHEAMIEAAATHGMSVGSFIVALCQAYIYCSPFILKQHLRPSMPPMTAQEYRVWINLCNNINQIARVMNEGRRKALEDGTDYPLPPEDLSSILRMLCDVLRVEGS